MSEKDDRTIDLTGGALEPGSKSERVTVIGERLRAAFQEACQREQVLGTLSGPATAMTLGFEQQESASPALILDTFLAELKKRGVAVGSTWTVPAGLTEQAVAAAMAAIQEAVARIRVLMVEYNSYLSAGLPYVFPTDSAVLEARGLSIYRYPAKGQVDVVAEDRAVRITFYPGALGSVTSSGFYVPTCIRGDFTAEIEFTVQTWRPGPANACFALFVQDEPSLVRYYAQRFTEAERPERHLAQANLAGAASEPRPVQGSTGAFRLVREEKTLSAWYREKESWERFGQTITDAVPDFYLGAKIWSSEVSDGLEVVFSGLTITGEIPADQTVALVKRPDPRHP
jgi:hypothetical protein